MNVRETMQERAGISPHHVAAAAMWGQGGKLYDDVSFAISDALAHAAQRLDAQPGEKVLDVATGTGWTARNVARTGARVTAVDISEPLLAAARELSAHLSPSIVFQLADAESLPFPAAHFDKVISTFGVMFAANQERAARELGRVCRQEGRLSLATWVPGGAVQTFFGIIGKYSKLPAPKVSPILWGDPEHVTTLLGRDFDLKFERGTSHAHHEGLEDIWRWYARGFGPVRAVFETLDESGRTNFKREIDAYHAHYMTDAGLRVDRDYLVTIGRRR